MPNNATEARLRVQARSRQKERTERIISAAMAAQGMTRRDLSARTGIGYPSLCKKVSGEYSMPVEDAIKIANALKMDEQTRAALLGSPKKCRFETGYPA